MAHRRRYREQFKQRAVRLVEAGVPPARVATTLGCSEGSVRRWARQAERRQAGAEGQDGEPRAAGGTGHAVAAPPPQPPSPPRVEPPRAEPPPPPAPPPEPQPPAEAPEETRRATGVLPDPEDAFQPWWVAQATAVPAPTGRLGLDDPPAAGGHQGGGRSATEDGPAAPAVVRSDGRQAPATPQAPAGSDGQAPVPPASAAAFTEERMLRPANAARARGARRPAMTGRGRARGPAGWAATDREARRLLERIKAPVRGCRKIAVISRKGGVGKTTTALMLGHIFAQGRADRVVALDGNPDAGSLGYRVRRETSSSVTDLLGDELLQRYAEVRAHTSQAPSRLEVVASDDDPGVTEAIGEKEYRQAILQLERHYSLILLDTGTGILDSATQGILRVADQVALVLSPSLDGARAASLTLDWLAEHGFESLVAGAVAVLNQSDEAGPIEIDRVEQHFAERCRATQRIPWDAHLAAGAESDPQALGDPCRRAYLQLAAKLADGFAAGR